MRLRRRATTWCCAAAMRMTRERRLNASQTSWVSGTASNRRSPASNGVLSHSRIAVFLPPMCHLTWYVCQLPAANVLQTSQTVLSAGGGNPEHLFIASQDRTLRAALMRQPGCAAVFASVNGLHLEAPSEAQKAEARSTEAQHLSIAPHELKVGPVKRVENLTALM